MVQMDYLWQKLGLDLGRGELPLFTELPRAVILGTPYTALRIVIQ
jgi:hypothetical protein